MNRPSTSVKTAAISVWSLCPESIALVGVCMADALVTIFLVERGLATEANPLMAWFLNYGAMAFLLVKILSFAPFVVVCEIYRRRNPLTGRAFIRLALFAYVILYVVLLAFVNLR